METRHDSSSLPALTARLEALEQEQARLKQAIHWAMRHVVAELPILPAATISARRTAGRPPDHLPAPSPARTPLRRVASTGRERVAIVSVSSGWERGRRGHATVTGLRIASRGGAVSIASTEGHGIYAESRDADAVVASSLNAHGMHAVGGGVRGGLGTSPGPCGVFAEGGTGDGVYATSKAVALHGVSPEGYGASLAGGTAPLHLEPAATVGAPTTGDHRLGTLYVDADAALWLCVADGTPGAWRQVVVR